MIQTIFIGLGIGGSLCLILIFLILAQLKYASILERAKKVTPDFKEN